MRSDKTRKGSAAGQQATARDPFVDRALEYDPAAGGATVGVRFVLGGALVAGEADVRMAAAPVAAEVGVADPDQTGALVALALGVELLAEAGQDAGLIGAPVAVADAVLALVLRPQPIGGVQQERVGVLGDGEVERAAADLEHAAALAVARTPDRDPDALDEEVVVEDVGEDALVLADAPGRRAEVAERVGRARGGVEVVLEQEPLRF